MRKAIELKSQVVSEIVEKLEKSSSAIVVDYKGLTVEEVTELRKKMREAGKPKRSARGPAQCLRGLRP